MLSPWVPYLFKAFCVRPYVTWSTNSIKKTVKIHAYHTFWCRKDQPWFFLRIFSTLPGLDSRVIENFTFLNVGRPTNCSLYRRLHWASTFRTVQVSNSVIYLLHICIVFYILSVFVFLYTEKRKEKWPLVFTPGKGLKIDHFEFSTHSLGLPISYPNAEGSIFRPSPVLSTFVLLFWSSRFIDVSQVFINFKPSFVWGCSAHAL